jgi:hypothetical protein
MSRVRVTPLPLGFFSIIVILLFAPVVINMISAGNDAVANIRYAAAWEQSGFFGRPRPHFLFQVLVIAASRFMPGSNNFALAGALVSILFYLFLGLIIYLLVAPLWNRSSSRFRSFATIAFSLGLMLVAPINLLTLAQQNLYWGYIRIHSYHNPPMTLLMPFALLLFLLSVRVFKGEQASVLLILSSTAVVFLGTIAKPSYAICLLPALALITLIALLQKQSIDWRLLMVGIVIPLGVVLFWQSQYHAAAGMGKFVIEPFKVMAFYSDNLLPKFLLSILFPAFILVVYWKNTLYDKFMQLAWLTFLVGASYTYLLAETEGWTVNWTDANFTWSAEITLFVLFVASTLFFLRQNAADLMERRFNWKISTSLVLLALHLVSGIIFYISSLSPNWRDWL